MGILEALLASGVGMVVVERLFDWIQRRRTARIDEIVRYAKAAFAQATHILRDPADRQLVFTMFEKLVRMAVNAAGLKLDQRTENKINETFAQLWEIWEADRAANELKDLVGKSKAGQVLDQMLKGVTR